MFTNEMPIAHKICERHLVLFNFLDTLEEQIPAGLLRQALSHKDPNAPMGIGTALCFVNGNLLRLFSCFKLPVATTRWQCFPMHYDLKAEKAPERRG